MTRVTEINHVTLIVDDLQVATTFYQQEFGLELLPAYKFDYPTAFFKINETQQLHITEWEDSPSYRGHVCLRVSDWSAAFKRFKALGIIDIDPWGKVRKLPDGTFQMFVRDPSGNLIEVSAPPGSAVDESIFGTDELCDAETRAFVSGRQDARGLQSDDASLYHGESPSE